MQFWAPHTSQVKVDIRPSDFMTEFEKLWRSSIKISEYARLRSSSSPSGDMEWIWVWDRDISTSHSDWVEEPIRPATTDEAEIHAAFQKLKKVSV